MANLVLGTAQFGMSYGVKNKRGMVSAKEVEQILRTSWNSGIRNLDTSADYGESESALGEAFQKIGFSFGVITKCPRDDSPMSAIQASLGRLRISSVEGFLFHDIQTFKSNPNYWIEMLAAQEKGLARRIGFSVYHPADVEFLFAQPIRFGIIQFPYNLFDRRFEYLFAPLEARGVQIHVRSVFLQGLLLMEPSVVAAHFAAVRDRITQIHDVAIKHGLSANALCLAFSSNPHEIDGVLIGVDGLADLTSNLSAFAQRERATDALRELGSVSVEDESIILPYLWPRRPAPATPS